MVIGGQVPDRSSGRSSGLLERFAAQYGQIVARERAEAALVAAKQDAEWAERRALIALKEAEKANASKTQFLANMSHELRTPLNAIIGFSEILANQMMGAMPAVYIDYAGDIRQSGAHLLALVNDILDISRIEAGRLDLAEVPVDLERCLKDAVAIVRPLAEAGELSLEVEQSGKLPGVCGDETKLKKILVNLIGNAVKFTPKGGRVTVSAQGSPRDGVEIAIADTGIGIAESDLALVLAPFGQVASAYCRGHDGSGLGLPISKALVELHDGTLEIDSARDAGTTILIRLPAGRTLNTDATVED